MHNVNTRDAERNQELIRYIKSLINFEEVFKDLFPEHYREHGNSLSPFREEKNPSYQVKFDHGFDHGTGKKHDVLDLYQLKHGCDLNAAIKGIMIEAGIPDPSKKTKQKVFNPFQDGKIVDIYDYENKDGKYIYSNVTAPSKSFFPSATLFRGVLRIRGDLVGRC